MSGTKWVHMRLRRSGWLAGSVAAAVVTALAMTASPASAGQATPAQATPGQATPAQPAGQSAAGGSADAGGQLPAGVQQVCAPSTGPQDMSCMSVLPARKPGAARTDLSGPTGSGYGPADLQSAYALAAASLDKGKGQTVAIVDAYNDPDAAADLAVYRQQWGLPACAAGCLTILNEDGQASPLPGVDPTGGWELEESTDLDMVSAICPNCHIELVEAGSTSLSDLGTAEDTAAASGAKFISDSWDGPDGYGSSADDQYFDHPGVVITVAAGDDGFGASYPAASQFVTSVGGTSLERAPGTARGWTESAWTGTGSGCSLNEPKPAWQTADDSLAGGCLNRTDNDVAAVADENTPVWLYDSYPFQGAAPQWGEVGGTSVASPIIASVYALAGAPLRGSYPASYPYAHTSDLFPVTSGTNGPCESTRPYLCAGGPGYNGPDGWGTPDGTAAFTAPAHTVTAFNPGFQDDGAGTSVRLRVKALASGGERLFYSARGLPRGLSIDPSAGLISGRLPAAAATDPVTVTVTDASGDRATVGFSFVIVPDLTAAYHPVPGPVTVGLPGLCLASAGPQAGAKIQVATCDGGTAQQWTYRPDSIPDGAGALTIDGQCLDIGQAGTAQASDLRLRPCTGRANQDWTPQDYGQNLVNPASGDCLDDPGSSTESGTQVDVAACDSASGQVFTLPPAPVTSAVSGQCLDVPGGSPSAGTAVDVAACDGSAEQLWGDFSTDTVKPTTHGGLCLAAVAPAGPTSLQWIGSPVEMETCRIPFPTIEEGWSILPDGQIMNNTANLCLDDPGDSTANGTQLVLQDCYGEAGEIWAVG
jgi:Ricin-type beta-trefoil lectin domain/Putative Ig domain/Subtilase family